MIIDSKTRQEKGDKKKPAAGPGLPQGLPPGMPPGLISPGPGK